MKKVDLLFVALIGLGALAFRKRDKIVSTVKEFFYPLYGKITNGFGLIIHPITGKTAFHNGIDITGKVGDKVKCPFNGVVSKVYFNDVGGNQLIIHHDNGFITGYAHLNKSLVGISERIKQGQVIAEVGKTGRVTGPHLHFTLRDAKGNYLNPLQYLV
jgi:murein DD-endopeptidase MepM/ murein hydrolase activator NlpD